MGWRVGNGKNINIGVDPIAGLNVDFALLEDLRAYLEDYGIYYLVDAHLWEVGHSSHRYWLTTEDLDLDDTWKVMWTNYINGLSHDHIQLDDRLDTLAWMYNQRTG